MDYQNLIASPFVTYLALLLTIISLWFSQWLWLIGLSAAIVIGYATGVLTGSAILWIAILGICLWYYHRLRNESHRRFSRIALAAVIVVVALLLGLHALPGFHNVTVARELVLSPDGAPFTLSLSFDKTVAGLVIIALLYRDRLRRRHEWRDALRTALPVIPVTIVIVMGVGLAIGYVRFDPKWTSFFWIWATVNLFFTVLSEEAFFRAFIQRDIASVLAQWRFGNITAILVAALLFGLAHFAGGAKYVALAAIAGVGYGFALSRSRRVEMAMLCHFSLNATHFLMFTYPFHIG
jgi:membrane protease YdiL (CAAX protease family)